MTHKQAESRRTRIPNQHKGHTNIHVRLHEEGQSKQLAADFVAGYIRRLIFEGKLTKGSRLDTERELATHLRVSRTSVRAGLQSLAAKGVVISRRGAGTFVAEQSSAIDSDALGLFAALHNLPRQQMFEARRTLEVRVAGMAAARARGEDLAAISDAVTGMFVSLNDPQRFLFYDIQFHQAVAAASANKILASLVDVVSAVFYERRRRTADRDRDLRPVAEAHHAIYRAIQQRNAALAEETMNRHLLEAERAQENEGPDPDDEVSGRGR
jgi:GntR family transcriptional repressor for pyruvate dehydrogenase complex